MGAPTLVIRGEVTDLRFTVASLKRIKQALGLSMAGFGKAIEEKTLDLEMSMGALVWAFIAHNESLRNLSVEDVAGGLGLRDIPAVLEAIQGVLSEEVAPGGPGDPGGDESPRDGMPGPAAQQPES